MDCVNHSGVSATAYCQNCGKALCAGCVRNAAGGQILCEPCWTAWQSYQQPFVAPPAGGPNPVGRGGAGTDSRRGRDVQRPVLQGPDPRGDLCGADQHHARHYGIFGIFIAAWVLYQSFEAYHTAKARRDGQPLPDPLGLNEVGNWLNLGARAISGPAGGWPIGTAEPGQGPEPGAGEGWTGQTRRGLSAPYQGSYQQRPIRATVPGAVSRRRPPDSGSGCAACSAGATGAAGCCGGARSRLARLS